MGDAGHVHQEHLPGDHAEIGGGWATPVMCIKNTFLEIMPRSEGDGRSRSSSAPPSISFAETSSHVSMSSSTASRSLDPPLGLQQEHARAGPSGDGCRGGGSGGGPGSAAAGLDSDNAEEDDDDEEDDEASRMRGGRGQQRRLPKFKRDRIKRFQAYSEGLVRSNPSLPLDKIALPPFLLEDPKVLRRVILQLAEFQAKIVNGDCVIPTASHPRKARLRRGAGNAAQEPGSEIGPGAVQAAAASAVSAFGAGSSSRPQRRAEKVLMSL